MAVADDIPIITRKEALAAGKKRYFTGEPCKHGHLSEFQTANATCCECSRIRKKDRFLADPDKARTARRMYYAKNAEKVKATNTKSNQKNRDSVLAGKKAYYERVKLSPEWQAEQARKRAEKRDWKREYDKQYRAKDPAKQRERSTAWRKANPERRKVILFSYTARRRAQVKTGDSNAAIRAWKLATPKICYWCGSKCGRGFHIDHYVPLSKGGLHVVSNLVIACPKCNLKKNAKDPYEFAATVGRLF